ncbi:MAG TPA: glycoside hydrolase [Geobacter sp.]|nr:glycoside hydrolase [Geobacter sp.]
MVLILLVRNLNAADKRGARPGFVVAISATPVLNTPAFRQMFSGAVKLDPCKGVRPIEFVALPGTLFAVYEKLEKDGVTVYRVATEDYPYSSQTGFFIDARFVREWKGGVLLQRKRHLPQLAEIQKRLLSALGKPYVWGGNVKDGVPLLRRYYPQGDPLAGVDCSGLLYEATDGFTTRNTSALITYGEPVQVAGLSVDAIAQKLKPLDLLVWDGHVMIVLDSDSIIQSTMGCGGGKSGVTMTPVREALRHLVQTRRPADRFPEGKAGKKAFVVRRWFSAGPAGAQSR